MTVCVTWIFKGDLTDPKKMYLIAYSYIEIFFVFAVGFEVFSAVWNKVKCFPFFHTCFPEGNRDILNVFRFTSI